MMIVIGREVWKLSFNFVGEDAKAWHGLGINGGDHEGIIIW